MKKVDQHLTRYPQKMPDHRRLCSGDRDRQRHEHADARRIRSGCCARAPSGHATVALPSSVMNARRLMPNIGLVPALGPGRSAAPSACHRWAGKSFGQT
jgi:hypothetical protein